MVHRVLTWVTFLVVCVSGNFVSAQQSSLPRILILGDSISMGYTPFVVKELTGVASVSRPTKNGKPENCAGTSYAIQNIERWISESNEPAIIFFNFGLHDLKHEDASGKASNDLETGRQAEPEKYREQLTQIVERLERTQAKLVFVATTPVPNGVKPYRSIGDPLQYNAIARTVVEPRGIDVLDLYTPVLEKIAIWQKPANVHFNPEGSSQLAKLVATKARLLLSDRAAPNRSIVAPWTADEKLVEKLGADGKFNYDESKVPAYELPPLISKVWENKERSVVLDSFAEEMYGRLPEELNVAQVSSSSTAIELGSIAPRVTAEKVEIGVAVNGVEFFKFPFVLFRPAGEGSFPTVVLIHNREFPDPKTALEKPIGFLPIEMIIEKGFAVAVFYTQDVEPDRADAAGQGIRNTCNKTFGDDANRSDYWGCLSAWAWGASRVLDAFENNSSIDKHHVYVLGHSRGGKTALWAAANDLRFAGAMSNESGCAGAALSRRRYGETLTRIGKTFPYWFAPKFQTYADREDELPLDQHQLIAAIAPRVVCVGSAAEDLWADPRGEFEALIAAGPAFSADEFSGNATPAENAPPMPGLGNQVSVGARSYHIRPGDHNLTEGDWLRYLDHIKKLNH